MSDQDPWAGLLDPDEVILWQGHPKPGLTFDFSQPMLIVMGLFFMGFSIFWMQTAAQAGGYFWTFGLIFFGIGFFNAIGVHFWKAYLRSKTHYTLTTKRGFVATNALGRRRLKSYPIQPDTQLELIDGPYASVVFATTRRRGKNGWYEVPITFERLEDGRDVLGLIRDVQKAMA